LHTPPPDFTTALGRSVKGLRIAWSPDFGGAPVDPEVVAVCARAVRAFEELGAAVEETTFKPDDPMTVLETFGTFSSTKTYATHLDAIGREDSLTDYFREVLERGRALSGDRLFAAYSRLMAYRAYTRDFFARWDLLLSPTLAVPAFPIGQLPTTIGGQKVAVPRVGFFPFTYPFNILGNPAATVPCGFSADRLPIGLQIVAKLEDELT